MEGQSYSTDYMLHVSLSEDKMNAYLHLETLSDDYTCTEFQLEQLLNSRAVNFGIRYEVLRKIAANPAAFSSSEVLIATGLAPEDGKDGFIKYQFDLENNTKKPLELEDGTVDYKEITTIHNVRKGELIAERIFAEEGVEGTAVTGEPIPAKKGKEARFKLGKNVVQDQEQVHLYAAIDGVISFTERERINVFPIYEVNGDLDFNTGNIDFVGTVVIRGNVLGGFRIKAEGDIRVTGGIEAAELIAGGSIDVGAGILGQNKGLVKAGKNVKSSFIQDSTVEAGETVIVTQSIMHSSVRAARSVLCQGTKGLIVGGVVQAGERITARTVGNTMSTGTVLEVGVLPELRNELVSLRAQIRPVTENLDKTDKALAILDQLAAAGSISRDKVEMRHKLSGTKKRLQTELLDIKERILELERSLEDVDKSSIEISSIIYSGCKIVIGRYVKFIRDSVSRVKFQIIEGDVGMVSKN